MAGLGVVLVKVVLQLKKFVVFCFYGYLVISDMCGDSVGKVHSIKKVTYQFPKACSLFKPDVYSSGYRIASCACNWRSSYLSILRKGMLVHSDWDGKSKAVFSNYFFHSVCSLPVWCSVASSLRLCLMFTLASLEVPAQNSADLSVENSSGSKNQSHLLWGCHRQEGKEDYLDGVLSVGRGGDVFLSV